MNLTFHYNVRTFSTLYHHFVCLNALYGRHGKSLNAHLNKRMYLQNIIAFEPNNNTLEKKIVLHEKMVKLHFSSDAVGIAFSTNILYIHNTQPLYTVILSLSLLWVEHKPLSSSYSFSVFVVCTDNDTWHFSYRHVMSNRNTSQRIMDIAPNKMKWRKKNHRKEK